MIITQEPAQSLAALDALLTIEVPVPRNSKTLSFPWWLRSSW
jgi:hypothetical protein